MKFRTSPAKSVHQLDPWVTTMLHSWRRRISMQQCVLLILLFFITEKLLLKLQLANYLQLLLAVCPTGKLIFIICTMATSHPSTSQQTMRDTSIWWEALQCMQKKLQLLWLTISKGLNLDSTMQSFTGKKSKKCCWCLGITLNWVLVRLVWKEPQKISFTK